MPRDCARDTAGRPSPARRTQSDPDDDLIARVAAGDPTAWPELVNRHLKPVWAYARRMLGDDAEAEDVAQETFVRLMGKAGDWQPGGARLGTWLHRVAMNLCIDRHRRTTPVSLDEVVPQPDPAAGGTEMEGRFDMTRAVNRALAALPQRQRHALVLVHYQGMSNIEAAETLETTVEAVESLLARARRALRDRMAPIAPDLLESRG